MPDGLPLRIAPVLRLGGEAPSLNLRISPSAFTTSVVIAFSFWLCHDQHRYGLWSCQEQPFEGVGSHPLKPFISLLTPSPVCPTFADGKQLVSTEAGQLHFGLANWPVRISILIANLFT